MAKGVSGPFAPWGDGFTSRDVGDDGAHRRHRHLARWSRAHGFPTIRAASARRRRQVKGMTTCPNGATVRRDTSCQKPWGERTGTTVNRLRTEPHPPSAHNSMDWEPTIRQFVARVEHRRRQPPDMTARRSPDLTESLETNCRIEGANQYESGTAHSTSARTISSARTRLSAAAHRRSKHSTTLVARWWSEGSRSQGLAVIRTSG